MAAPSWFRVVAALGLVWNLLGVAAFVAQLTTDPASLAPLERQFYETTPVWAHAAFGIAVASGTLGCVALLLKRSWASTMLLLCAGAIVVQIAHSLVFSNGLEVFGATGLLLPLFTLTIAGLLAWLGRWAKREGILALS